MNRQIIKVNGTDTPVISSGVSIKAYPPMPQHEPTPPELKKPGMNAKKWTVAFRKWAQAEESRHTAALAEWRKNRDDIVSLTIMFPTCVFTWASPRSRIPGRKKEFAIQDIIEIDSRLCVHLRDGRNLGMGEIEELATDVKLAYELMIQWEARPEDIKRAEGIIAAGRLIAANAPPAAIDPWKNTMNKFRVFKAQGIADAQAWNEVARIIVQGVKKSPQHTSDYLSNKESVTLNIKINSTKGSLDTVIEKEAARLLKKWQRKAK